MKKIRVIGGGLAGPEAALQAAAGGCTVELFEMRPGRSTEAHQTADFAELVCSNSLKSESENTAPWLLKQEMRRAGCFLLREADATAVPAGHALAVDRAEFSRRVAGLLEAHPRITIRREEVVSLEAEEDTVTILASGPLTSAPLAAELQRLTGADHLAFFDSISPIVDATTIDMEKVYFAARYDKGTADYINCPFTKEEYERFLDALTSAEEIEQKAWEQVPADGNPTPVPEKMHYFEGCLPIEETARRGRDTLRFGPMKPVGLTDPKTGRWPYAVVQLRQENLRADSYNLVGFQNHLKYAEQKRVLRLIPGLEQATFLRFGQIHRNTYIHAPTLLTETLQLRAHPGILVAGQLSGVEGYTESIASGMLAGRYAAALARGEEPEAAPRASAHGSLTHYITHAEVSGFSRRTSRSICCRRWRMRCDGGFGIRRSGIGCSASGHWRLGRVGWVGPSTKMFRQSVRKRLSFEKMSHVLHREEAPRSMAMIEFVRNYTDHSTDRGYQFEFRCDHCSNGYMSSYEASMIGTAGSLLQAAGSIFGGILGSAGTLRIRFSGRSAGRRMIALCSKRSPR